MFEKINIPLNTESSSATGYFLHMKENIFAQGKRPVVIVCAGGGYINITDIETEPVAFQFLATGCSVVVLNYTVGHSTFPNQFQELGKVIYYLRKNKEKLGIDSNNIVIQGASAGGHLAVAYSQMWEDDFISDLVGINEDEKHLLKPNGIILCYPGILYGEWIDNLLGENYIHFKDKLQLTKNVKENFPRTFIWQCNDDPITTMPHSLELVCALCEKHIPTEYHVFEKGGHALATAKAFTRPKNSGGSVPCNVNYWVDMANNWIWANDINEEK